MHTNTAESVAISIQDQAINPRHYLKYIIKDNTIQINVGNVIYLHRNISSRISSVRTLDLLDNLLYAVIPISQKRVRICILLSLIVTGPYSVVSIFHTLIWKSLPRNKIEHEHNNIKYNLFKLNSHCTISLRV